MPGLRWTSSSPPRRGRATTFRCRTSPAVHSTSGGDASSPVVARLHDLRAVKRHRVRIEAKKLRYGCEFFASLYAADEPRAVTSDGEVLTGPLAYAWHVEDVQSTLGILNDQATANGLLASVGAEVPPIDEKTLVDAGVEACAHLSSLPRFWR